MTDPDRPENYSSSLCTDMADHLLSFSAAAVGLSSTSGRYLGFLNRSAV